LLSELLSCASLADERAVLLSTTMETEGRRRQMRDSLRRRANMFEKKVTLPELALVAGTRAVLGVGLGLLLAGRLSDDQRRAVGWSLFLVGALSTIPLAVEVLGEREALSEKLPRGALGNTETANVSAQA
jgi:hypothetical protein